ncbi:MAG: YggT family protein [Eubacteriales bacterium]|nr:YggT family protein [Eubacteriales bacterium]MDD3881698.1 YggT family protein [Eubacteriales bacterium]MDD4512243.1 YggT family protein [Eubacteriales bacterium]
MVIYTIYSWVYRIVSLISFILFAYCILSWFLPPQNKLMQFLARIIEPILEPFRRLLRKRFGWNMPIDFSPILLGFALQLIMYLLQLLVRAIA